MAPMIFSGIFYERAETLRALPWLTLIALAVCLASQFNWIPGSLWGIRLDLSLLVLLGLAALGLIAFQRGRVEEVAVERS